MPSRKLLVGTKAKSANVLAMNQTFTQILQLLTALFLGSNAYAGAADLVPHRAVYDMHMTSSKNGSAMTDVEGEMTYSWSDSCDGWTVEQKLALKYYPAEGDVSERITTLNSWEAKNGKSYRFASRTMTDGEETDNLRGSATLGLLGGEAKITVPPGAKPIRITSDTLFPSAHTLLLLDNAKQGSKFLNRVVFDGADERGQVEINAFIGKPDSTFDKEKVPTAIVASPLIQGNAYPIRLAFFGLETGADQPDYEMELKLMGNGVARSLLIDFGDFILSGSLKKLEELPKPKC